ncbi:MAG: DUF5675 family protein [Prevotellaceae bacterium]|nr:DUF5675 family protein [Prevotellaceae bacterium]
MTINLIRSRVSGEALDGQIIIDGQFICCTAENAMSRIPAGKYEIHPIKCRQHARKVPMLFAWPLEGTEVEDFVNDRCGNCHRRGYVSGNAVMPHYCPMITTGNGIHGRNDGSIIVGNYICPGCLKNSRKSYDILSERIRKAVSRGYIVFLNIIEK